MTDITGRKTRQALHSRMQASWNGNQSTSKSATFATMSTQPPRRSNYANMSTVSPVSKTCSSRRPRTKLFTRHIAAAKTSILHSSHLICPQRKSQPSKKPLLNGPPQTESIAAASDAGNSFLQASTTGLALVPIVQSAEPVLASTAKELLTLANVWKTLL